MRLDIALIRRHPELSRRRAREVIEKGQVTLGGGVVLEAGRDVPEDAAIDWNPNRKARRSARSSLPLLFEDDRLLVVDKPAGLLSVPSSAHATSEDTALARVREYVSHLRPRNAYVGLVHRIDRDTSGALAFALDAETRRDLIRLFKVHQIERRYLALVRGEPREPRGRIDVPIAEAYEGHRRIAGANEPSREAVTHYVVRERLGVASLLELTLGTGRQHQIRLHLAHVGHPILGEKVYGPDKAPSLGLPLRRQMLHAALLAFDHPWRDITVRAESPLPQDFEVVLRALRARRQGR